MVRGLETFKEFFRGYEDNYVLIGGTASTLIMEDAGLQFRATVDLDIVFENFATLALLACIVI